MFPSLFLFFAAIAGAAASVTYRWVPPLMGLSSAGSSLLLGALAGLIVAGLILVVWRSLAPTWRKEGVEARIANAMVVALATTLLGIALAFGFGIAFPTHSGGRVAQGIVLIASTLIGLRIGFALEKPIWKHGEANRPPTHVRERCGGETKLLDTSIIIDGRIGSLVSTGFIEGELLVPEFVLAELQNIADSSNSLRRRKGRRGLDILNEMMHDDSVSIRVISVDYPEIREVDRKLIRLAKDEEATLVTTDFNLNRVAQVEGVRILNVNELANAVKPRFIPGEGISVEIIDRGEEINQGIGYLDDGTMVVVENGRRHIGRTIKATVKSTLQTEAGRMLFVEPAGEPTRWQR